MPAPTMVRDQPCAARPSLCRRGGCRRRQQRSLRSEYAGPVHESIGSANGPAFSQKAAYCVCHARSPGSLHDLRDGLSRQEAAEPTSAESRRACPFRPGASPTRRPAYMCSVLGASHSPGAFTSARRVRSGILARTQPLLQMVRTRRDDREPGCTSTSRTWGVSRAALCQRQPVLSDF